jgi:acetoin utilization deacetylase AcuC-like enzyme
VHDLRQAIFVYSRQYAVDLFGHVFPTEKYPGIVARLTAENGLDESIFLEPELAGAEDILTVHTSRYYAACRDSRLSAEEIALLELPWHPAIFRAAALAVHGSFLAAAGALDAGVGCHVGGGFHHAFPDHGEGFCVFHDVGCAIRMLTRLGRIQRALVIDADLHHGNGTAFIFRDDPAVSTYSIHEEGIYPLHKPPSDCDVGLAYGTGDDTYLRSLRDTLLPFVDDLTPDLVFYVAGADPFEDDQLGSLRLSKEGLLERDRVIVELCASRGWPLAVVLAGGYARDPADTIDIQLATLRLAAGLGQTGRP